MNKRNYWGPLLWESINTIVREYPESPSSEDRQNYKLFFQSLGDVLPCPSCRQHYNAHLRKLSIDVALESRDSLINFIIDLHNEVNKATGKSVMNRETARNIIEGNYIHPNTYYYIVGSIVLLSSVYYIVKR
jgi:hypothetical protein